MWGKESVMRLARLHTPFVLLLASALLSACSEQTSTDLGLEEDLHAVRSVLAPPSGYTVIDLTPALPGGHTASGDLINDSRQTVFHIRDETTSARTYYLWEEGVTSSYGTDVRVLELNNAGQAVGWNAVPEATLWNRTDPTTLAGLGSRAFDITESGLVTGEIIQGSLPQAFIWENGILTPLGNPPGALFTQGRDVNDSGQVIGRLVEVNPLVQLGFFWSQGVFTRITMPSADFSGVSMGSTVGDDNLNDVGDFVGMLSRAGAPRGFFWSEGVMTVIPTLGGEGSTVSELNQASQVVGSAQNSDGFPRAFLWDAGTMTELGTLGGTSSRGLRVNDRGQVAGTSTTPGGDWHAFVSSDGVMTDLGTLGGLTSRVNDINEFGEVVGTAEDADGVMHAVLWRLSTPTEEIEAIENLLDDLLTNGLLSPDQVDGLSAKLTAVVRKIERSGVRAAVNQLGAFVNQVQAFVNDGSLSEEDGRILVAAAEAVMEDLTG